MLLLFIHYLLTDVAGGLVEMMEGFASCPGAPSGKGSRTGFWGAGLRSGAVCVFWRGLLRAHSNAEG